jgi:hypothetical protein
MEQPPSGGQGRFSVAKIVETILVGEECEGEKLQAARDVCL